MRVFVMNVCGEMLICSFLLCRNWLAGFFLKAQNKKELAKFR
ncbi:hypothetical protein ACFFMS_00380 [Ectobacillus funiculus]|uniref:Uncharacterized protein n=1 Tax=Ectobacillus funiculus TaxID=137993 RepID=A0ABV5W9F2_9BACI